MDEKRSDQPRSTDEAEVEGQGFRWGAKPEGAEGADQAQGETVGEAVSDTEGHGFRWGAKSDEEAAAGAEAEVEGHGFRWGAKSDDDGGEQSGS